jgi:hypothetical protein
MTLNSFSDKEGQRCALVHFIVTLKPEGFFKALNTIQVTGDIVRSLTTFVTSRKSSIPSAQRSLATLLFPSGIRNQAIFRCGNRPMANPITIVPMPDLVQEVVSAEATPRLWLGAPFQSLG